MDVYIYAALLVFVYFNLFYLLSILVHDYSIVDVGWGLGFVVVSIFTLVLSVQVSLPQIVVSVLIIIWGARLSAYIFIRNHNKPEDFRYREMRENWGKTAWIQSYLKVFMLQGAIMWLMSLPLLYLSTSEANSIGFFSAIFALIAVAGIGYEAIADYQLYQFKSNPDNKGLIFTLGVWKYSRHPNYFGEIIFWWGLCLFVLAQTHSLISLVSAAIITLLLFYVSGVPLLENKRKDDDVYMEYVKRTNCIFPRIKGILS